MGMNNMNHFDINLDDMDFADEMIKAIEDDCGRSIVRIAKFDRGIAPYSYHMTAVFTDFKILEATIRIVPTFFDLPNVQVEGIYY